jgi:glycosyltransferase involved in cell wall biosynthesis
MKVLFFIKDGIMGGRERHVLTLVKSLPREIECCICAVSAGETTEAMQAAGLNVRVLGGRNGHDVRVLPRFVNLLREFKPNIVHAHSGAFLPFIAMRFFPKIALVQSVHGPSVSGAELAVLRKSFVWKMKTMAVQFFERQPDYFLPVSKATWDEFKSVNPSAKGEVFFNALNLDELPEAQWSRIDHSTSSDGHGRGKIVGMVGRMADVKDWPSFAKIARLLRERMPEVEVWGVGANEKWARENVGADAQYVKWLGSRQDAQKLISQMNVFVMTSKYEQLPTTLLEAFAIGVPVVGFLPAGGAEEVLQLSSKQSAILLKERNCDRVVDKIVHVMNDESFCEGLVCTGRKIVVEHFNMKKLCATQLVRIYKEQIKER